MTIRTRLSVIFSILVSSVFIVFGLTVFLLSSNHQKHEFEEQLKERVVITEKIFLEKDSYSPAELEKITNEFLHTLPYENEEVVPILPNSKLVFKYKYPREIQKQFLNQNSLFFEYDNYQGVSKIFRVNGKDYLVIVQAIDKVGLQNLSFLKKIIMLLILLGIPLIFIGIFVITQRELQPISDKIEKANTISASSFHERLHVHNANDELGKLAIAFNNLLDRLEASFESQKSFIRNASHEIRNPVTAIMGEAEISMSKPRTYDEYMEALATILNEAETLNSTVNNLLQLSKVDTYDGKIQFETIRFDKFLIEIKESFDFINPNNQIALDTFSQKDKDAFLIVGNKSLLKTAIINLLDNACKFSSNSKVDVILKCEANKIKLSIIDSGLGIAADDMDKIMSPFCRGHNAIQIKGSGIGLSLSSKIISLHKGLLNIRSEIDKGTTVQIELPIL